MSTRVQKGGTVFRPVAKARPRVTEESSRQPSVSQDVRASHPPPDAQKNLIFVPPEDIDIASAALPPPSEIPSQLSLRDSVDQVEVVPPIPITAHVGVPIVISSSKVATQIQVQATQPHLHTAVEEHVISAGPSQSQVPVVELIAETQRRKSTGSESVPTPAPPKSRKARRPVTPAFDVDGDPGEDLDPTSVTMATLCGDTGQGRVSSKASQILSNHLSWKKSNKEKRARMRMLMEAKKYGRSEEGEHAQPRRPAADAEQNAPQNTTPGPPSQPSSGASAALEDASGQGFDYSEAVATSRYNVQIRIGPNGETIVDEESLFVDRNAEEDTSEYTHVEESDVTKFVNSGTYSKRFRGSRWSAEETELFYDALSQFGENYELISYVLPGRDRKACKNKFKAEDKKNSNRINYCLNNRKPYDMQTLSRLTGKDFSGPTPEIRAPAALTLDEQQQNNETGQPLAKLQPETSTAETEDAEEIVGGISSFDPE